MKKKITSILLTILFGGILYYISLPAINFTNIGFYMYIFMILIFYYFIDLTLNFNLKRINLRNTPELVFELDESLEYGARIDKIINDLKKKE